MKLRQKQPNPKKYRETGTNLSAIAALGHSRIKDRKGRCYVFDEKGTMRRAPNDEPKATA